jgi:hypothetical protein
MKPTLEYLMRRLAVDVAAGTAVWIDATPQHVGLNGRPAGSARMSHNGKRYWHIKVDGKALKRSHIVFLFAHGRWPVDQIDHINGDSLDDRGANLREATPMQNAWNHQRRAKRSSCPMGVRRMESGRFQARIACNKRTVYLGTFATEHEATQAYQQQRKELFGEYA